MEQSAISSTTTTTTMLGVSKKNNSNKKGRWGCGEQQKRSSSNSTTNATMTMRKGPWTEEEDAQLVWFVRLFGERRWDFLAKVSGLKRTGKSCRLRWVNYLHPGLRRGRITADEERLILDLHAKWGSRWSRIARSIPGRTDNEIKNFWRTRVRKQKAQIGGGKQHRKDDDDDKQTAASSSSLSSSVTTTAFVSSAGCSSNSAGGTATSKTTVTESVQQGVNADDDDEASTTTTTTACHQEFCGGAMDQLWNEIAAADVAAASYMTMDGWGIGHAEDEPPLMMMMPSSPVWEFCSDYSLWRIDDEE